MKSQIHDYLAKSFKPLARILDKSKPKMRARRRNYEPENIDNDIYYMPSVDPYEDIEV